MTSTVAALLAKNFWACPTCNGSLVHESHTARDGVLKCGNCTVLVPVLDDVPYFTESVSTGSTDLTGFLSSLSARLFGHEHDYARFLMAKGRHPTRDAY